ncbi:MAG: EamA family transporter [Boseongicola sp.]|nr:MAG: EamA family transporter [Boseongicola sp.]
MRELIFLLLCLAVMGAGWGATQPLAKIATSEGYRHIGLIFWQLAIGALVMFIIQTVRGKRLILTVPALKIYLLIALIGTILPNSASYEAIRHLPSGIISILLSLVPMMAFPIALALYIERFQPIRFIGLVLGLIGVLLIVAPEASLPERAALIFIPLALVAPAFYALEGNVVAKWGTAGLGPVAVLYGASVVGAIITFPAALLSGEFIDPRLPWSTPDYALILASVIHVLVYTCYVWMVKRAGPVFAVQVSYLVTGFGVGWAMLILGESYSIWVWAAMAVILSGVFLVQPRSSETLVDEPETGKT